MAQLQLTAVHKSYGPVKIIHGVDLEIPNGEFVVFVGPSGCGKSTLLRMIAGLEEITSGTIAIDGAVVNDIPAADRGLALVFQSYALYPHMSVYQNMAFGLENMGLPRAEIEKRVGRAATMLRLDDYLQRKPRMLSGGQRQRVAIGRAIVRDPKIFLFDEPLSNLDAELRVAMRKELAALHAEIGGTMVYVTHDQVEAMTLADRIVVLRAGRIEQVGSPRQLYDAPANPFVAEFLGRANLLADGGSGGSLLVRPEQLRLQAHGPTDGERGQRARIVDVSFQGSLLQVTLAQEAGPPLLAQVSRQDGEGSLRSGDVVWAVWDPTTAHHLPASLPRAPGSPP